MTADVVAAVRACVSDIASAVAPGRPAMVLILGDPRATLCSALADDGCEVVCCPDLQRAPGTATDHRRIAAHTVAELVDSTLDVDIVVAATGWTRMLAVNPPGSVARLIEWMRTHATASLVEVPRRVLAPDLNELGAFRTLEMLGAYRFLAEPDHVVGDLDTPLVIASDHVLLAAGEWFTDDEVEWIGADQPDAWLKPVRTFRIPGDRIVKVEATSEDYFERTQVLGEWAFLREAAQDRRVDLRLPAPHDLVRGRAVATMVREDVAGGPPDADLTMGERLDGIVDAASRYAEAGLFHNDVRPWNVLWQGRDARLIDFADCSRVDDDVRDLPQVLALAASLAAVATDEIRGGEHFHDDALAIAHAGGLLERWPLVTQFGEPWWSVPRLRGRLTGVGGERASAVDVMRLVLEVTLD